VHCVVDGIDEPSPRERDLVRQRDALKIARILPGKLLGEAAFLRELSAQRGADRRPLLHRVRERRRMRRRRVHTGSEKQDALLRTYAVGDQVQRAAQIGRCARHQASICRYHYTADEFVTDVTCNPSP
jgi:hypothetical protein